MALALTLTLLANATRSHAQEPSRSAVDAHRGPARRLFASRYVPPRTVLPPDPDRDYFFFGRRWSDRLPTFPNFICTSGLYGLPLTTRCTATYAPYFAGTPGGSTAGICCQPVHLRVLNNFVHPWRPVGGYYSGGCAVPIYDLDPVVPGPGPFPFPYLYKRQHQGG